MSGLPLKDASSIRVRFHCGKRVRGVREFHAAEHLPGRAAAEAIEDVRADVFGWPETTVNLS